MKILIGALALLAVVDASRWNRGYYRGYRAPSTTEGSSRSEEPRPNPTIDPESTPGTSRSSHNPSSERDSVFSITTRRQVNTDTEDSSQDDATGADKYSVTTRSDLNTDSGSLFATGDTVTDDLTVVAKTDADTTGSSAFRFTVDDTPTDEGPESVSTVAPTESSSSTQPKRHHRRYYGHRRYW